MRLACRPDIVGSRGLTKKADIARSMGLASRVDVALNIGLICVLMPHKA